MRTKTKLKEKVYIVRETKTFSIHSIHRNELNALRVLNDKGNIEYEVVTYELEE